jgi:hypothetical protein
MFADFMVQGKESQDHLLDLISSQGTPAAKPTEATKAPPAKAPASTPAKPGKK